MSETIRILCHVSAAFHDSRGNIIHAIPSSLRHIIHDAPAEIQSDVNFTFLVDDGSLEVVHSPLQQKQLESDPVQNTDAEGKKPKTEKSPAKG